jgi:hypothetical protein
MVVLNKIDNKLRTTILKIGEPKLQKTKFFCLLDFNNIAEENVL